MYFFKKKIKQSIILNIRRIVLTIMMLSIAFLCVAASISPVNTFVVYKGDEEIVFKSTETDFYSAVVNENIAIDESQYFDVKEKNKHGIVEIYVREKKKITLIDANEEILLYSQSEKNIDELFKVNGIELNEYDTVSVALDSSISDGMSITITRIEHVPVTETVAVPFSTEKRASASMLKGKTNTIQNGVNGSKDVLYDVVYTNGVETSRGIVSETVTLQPVNAIVEYGTKLPETSGVLTTKSGEKLSYKNVITMTATAYTTERSSDKITATGRVAAVGLVAVDPKVIPLGSKLYIEGANGKWVYGTAVAADTGVRGNKIDLFFNTYNECISFGRRKAKVYILK